MAAIDMQPPPRPLAHSRSRSIDAALTPLHLAGLTRSHASNGIATIAVTGSEDDLRFNGDGPRKARRIQLASSHESALPPPVPLSPQSPGRHSRASGSLHGRRNSEDGEGSGSARGLSTDFGPDTADEDTTDHEVKETTKFVWGRDPRGRRMVNQYVRIDEIGRGVHGKVWLCEETNPFTGEAVGYCAMKEVYREDKRMRKLRRQRSQEEPKFEMDEKVRQEIAIMKRCNHPHVVRLKEVINDRASKKIFMVLEYMAGGQITWRGLHGEPLMTVDEARRTIRDVVLGLEYLHFQGIIHRDIKPANLLWDKSDPVTRIVKISDFGVSHVSASLSESADDESLRRKTAGSPAFFAPELCYSQETPSVTPTAPRDLHLEDTRSSGHSGNYFASRPSSGVSPNEPLHPPSAGRRRSSQRTVTAISKPLPQNVRSLESKKRPPVNKGIDVWALGITLYCLLFGTTPFVASNEYELFNIIPTTEIYLPDAMGADRKPVYASSAQNEEDAAQARETFDLLARLLEKDPMKRITLREVKSHPWILRNLEDPAAWMHTTDPEANDADGAISVTTEEVAAATKPRLADDELAKPKGGRTAALVRATHVLGLKHLSKRLAKGLSAPTPQPVPTSAFATPSSALSPQRTRSNSGSKTVPETHLVRGLLERFRGGSKTPRAAHLPRRLSASTEDSASSNKSEKDDAIAGSAHLEVYPIIASRNLAVTGVHDGETRPWASRQKPHPPLPIDDDTGEEALSDDASDDDESHLDRPLAWANSRSGWSFARRRGSLAPSFGEADAEVEDSVGDAGEHSADEDVEISIRGRSAQPISPARSGPPSPLPPTPSRQRIALSPIPSRSGST